jgi:transcriptional regulator with XRE-family HTH domain
MALRRRVARNIRKLAAEAELPLNQLADRADMARSHLYGALATNSSLTTDALTRLANALDADVTDLLA